MKVIKVTGPSDCSTFPNPLCVRFGEGRILMHPETMKDLFDTDTGGTTETEPREGIGTSDLFSVVRSVYESQDDILRGIMRLHCPEGFECDMTYGNGAFWKNLPRPKYCFDVSPQKPEAVKACSMMLPLEGESLRNCVFDPPFLTYVKNGRKHKGGKVAMTARFGGYYTYDELEDHYRHTLSEAYRVLKPGGIMVFKCQDIIHNHRMHCTHYRTIMMAEIEGFRLKDLFILPARHRMPGPQKGTQRHARVWHSYFLVLAKPGKLPSLNAGAVRTAVAGTHQPLVGDSD